MGTRNEVERWDEEQHNRRLRAWEMRKQGSTYRQIADELGVSEQWARQLIKQAFKAREEEPAAEVRAIEMDRLDIGLRVVCAILQAFANQTKDPTTGRLVVGSRTAIEAVNALRMISESRRNLMGANLPHAVSDVDEGSMDVFRQAEADLLRVMKQRPANRDRALRDEAD